MILVVGKSAFLAKSFLATHRPGSIRVVTHAQLGLGGLFNGIERVINFAWNPALSEVDYREDLDVDLAILRAIGRRPIRYVMLSSRKAYADPHKWLPTETTEATGDGVYGRNKVAIESRLRAELGDRLLVVRLGDAFGHEHLAGRRTFMSTMCESLVRSDEIRPDMGAAVRRDFVPVPYFCAALSKLIELDAVGAYNLGSGVATTTGQMANGLIEGFGRGRLTIENDRVHDEFLLDSGKLVATTGLACSADAIATLSREIGAQLARPAPTSFGR